MCGQRANNGYTAGTYGQIDNLVYNYKPNPTATDLSTVTANTASNKLLNVKDMSLSYKGFKFNSKNSSVPTYTYDDNGNLTSDLSKNITNIQYNYLNLPMKITFGTYGVEGFNEIYFVYDATGQKHQKITHYYVSEGTELEEVIVYDYINGVEYYNDYLKRIAHTEGAVVRDAYWGAGTFEHEYVLRDHLGNIRVTFKDIGNDGLITSADLEKMQVNHYYPFGLNMEGNWSGGANNPNKYQYNGKELNQDFGLDWNDYGARFYDPAIGRWPTVDSKADLYHRHTPYEYALNTPINAKDPDGNLVIFINGMHNGTGGTKEYWRSYYTAPKDFNQVGRRESSDFHKVECQAFDIAVMNRLNDHHPHYVDGAIGGTKGLFSLVNEYLMTNLEPGRRYNVGFSKGLEEAGKLIESLQRDGNGNIIESIKIITHSMGASFAKGYVEGLLEYAKRHNVDGVKIAFEADFAPFQPGMQQAVKGKNMGSTFQFSHKDDPFAGANQMEGADRQDTSGDATQGHGFLEFMNQVSKLPEGNYKVVDGKIIPNKN
jgi:RHS repeat-associated protein